MSISPPGGQRSALASVRQFMKRRTRGPRCELCAADLTDDHAHVVELASRRLCCTCTACALLFSDPAGVKYRRVPWRIEFVRDFRLTDVQWQGLDLPINLAFFTRSTAAGRVVALYPSPGGATEALPPPDAWEALLEDNPSLRSLEPDVEALLINRLDVVPLHYYVGIDECYTLVGLVRTHWRGLSGGTAVWEEVGRFFTRLKERRAWSEGPRMLELNFHVDGAAPERFAALPILNFKLRVTEAGTSARMPTPIHSALLRCQIRIEPARRRYGDAEKEQLLDLFGTPERWGQTLRPLLWTHTTTVLRAFTGATEVDLPVSCSYDFSLAATKYFDALQEGEIPLCFLFSGTVFYEAAQGGLQVAQISWEKEAYFRLPALAWRSLMDLYYPASAWLCLRKDVFSQLSNYKSYRNLATWEQAVEALLSAAPELATP